MDTPPQRLLLAPGQIIVCFIYLSWSSLSPPGFDKFPESFLQYKEKQRNNDEETQDRKDNGQDAQGRGDAQFGSRNGVIAESSGKSCGCASHK